MKRTAAALIVGVCFAFITAGLPLAAQPAPVISLSRTVCYGSCPVYDVSIFADGTVRWNGERFVQTIGPAASSISSQQVNDLIQSLVSGGFFNFKDSYRYRINANGTTTSVSDQSTTFLTVRRGEVSKKIEDYAFSPDGLRGLELLVDRTANSHRWIHDENAVMTLASVEPSYEFSVAEDLKDWQTVLSDVSTQTKPGFTKLMQAAGQGDMQRLERELKSGVNVNGTDETGWTALMMAAVAGQTESVASLIEHGAQVGLADKNGDTALIGAAANPLFYAKTTVQIAVVQKLLAAGTSVEGANLHGETALMWSAKAGSPELVQLLIKAGANPKRRDVSGHDASYAVQQWLAVRSDDTRRNHYKQTLSVLQQEPK